MLRKQIDEYIAWKASYTKRAWLIYKPWLLKFDKLVDKKLEDIVITDIVKYRKHIEDHYSPYSVQLAMVVLHNFFKFYKLQDVKCISPQFIRVPQTIAKSYQHVTPDEFNIMLSCCKTADFIGLRNTIMIRLLWETGMRVSELCDLDISDITPHRQYAVIRTKKTSRQRQVFWSESTEKLLLEYLAQKRYLSSSSALFIGTRGLGYTNRLSTRMVERMVTDLAHNVGIRKRISPHSFRHGKAHLILQRGGTVKHVQAILGHSEKNPAASFVYLQLNNQEMEMYAKKYL